ncbi:Hypothetical predicted protein [Octopus vulgaris]|uniref:Oxysterol-binding protein n=1 Tax=Octopus vulgaris TaxID=6645 RepID=A0AA36AYD6_OCTVU|nr:Hypothetical predicted protein [Octopus vulgaris]
MTQKISESKLYSPMAEKSNMGSKQSKRESLKMQKKNYRSQKKQVARELLTTLSDPSVIILADWLKIRGSLKSWTKLWCVLKPGLLVLYKSEKQKSSHWIGTILLNTCRLIERPSKKDGFCFKLFHPLDQSIWATKGPKGETIGALFQPLPYSHLIFRAPSESDGKCWMDGLELALRCTSLLMKSMVKDQEVTASTASPEMSDSYLDSSFQTESNDPLDESDCEKHFANQGLDEDCKTDRDEAKSELESEFSNSEEEEFRQFNEDLEPVETIYSENEQEELGLGDECQTEEVNEEEKSLIWALLKQVRPGMDLSKVVLPTFILEPRSFLDKLSDYYYHADLLSEAVLKEDPYTRMKCVVRWYLSGFYKKPKGLKKPYNPIIGETFRCYWRHPKTNTRTFYIAEQISHHPPISAFYVTNRQDGFSLSGSILARSKFYGNTLSALLDGTAKLTFLSRGEDYFITMPYAHCKGILIGTLTMEMGGKVCINCPKTTYRCELEFKLKPFLGSGEASNRIVGRIKMGSDTLAVIEGHWDQEVFIKDKRSEEIQMFWNPTQEVISQRLKRFTVPLENQNEMESELLWKKVSDAILKGDINTATQEKYFLEDRQRQCAKERKALLEEWIPNLFERDPLTLDWVYKHADMRPWDPCNDLLQYESEYVIKARTRHRTPMVRARSLSSLDKKDECKNYSKSKLCSNRMKRPSLNQRHMGEESGSSTPDLEINRHDSDSSNSGHLRIRNALSSAKSSNLTDETFLKAIETLSQILGDTQQTVHSFQQQLTVVRREQQHLLGQQGFMAQNRDWVVLTIILVFQAMVQWVFK